MNLKSYYLTLCTKNSMIFKKKFNKLKAKVLDIVGDLFNELTILHLQR